MDALKDSRPVSDGRNEIDRYLRAEQDLDNANRSLNSAQCEIANAANSLGKWLCPAELQS